MASRSNVRIRGPYPYRAPVAAPANPAAHSGVCYRDERSDGAERLRNVNGQHEEIGPWLHGLWPYATTDRLRKRDPVR